MTRSQRLRRGLRRRARLVTKWGRAVRCPCCGHRFRRFAPDWNRADAICWWCGAHERHRALERVLARRPDLVSDARTVLHVAPEWMLERRLRAQAGAGYVSVDLEPGHAMVAADVAALPFEDGRFDLAVASHVLEHVDDDIAALRELRRVLKPTGRLLVMVPVEPGMSATREDPAARTPQERRAAFLQDDHRRLYGADVAARLALGGFAVTVERPEGGERERRRYGLLEQDEVYVCVPAA